MTEATDDQEAISDQDLDEIHATHSYVAHDLYRTDENVNPKLKDKYFDKLQERIDRIYKKIKDDNDEKRRIAEEQNERTRQMMKLELQCAILFREKMRKLVGNYMGEDDLSDEADTCQRTVLDEFQIKALDNKVMPGSKLFQEHFASLKAKLVEEYEQIAQINREKKDTLKKTLESHTNKVIVEYERVFKTLLKDTYMEKEDLAKRHEEVVEKLMSSLRTAVGNNTHLPIVQSHLHETENQLNGKYSMVEEWNEKNTTFLRKCFKVVKTLATPMVALFGRLRKLF